MVAVDFRMTTNVATTLVGIVTGVEGTMTISEDVGAVVDMQAIALIADLAGITRALRHHPDRLTTASLP